MRRSEAGAVLPGIDPSREATGTRIGFASLERGPPGPQLAARADPEIRAPIQRAVPVETAIQIVYDPVPYAVMMATPDDFEDFATGFSLTEGVIDTAGDIKSIRVAREDKGLRLVIQLASDTLTRHLGRSRAMAGRTGCGLCGIDDLSHLPQGAIRDRSGPAITAQAIARALHNLEQLQPLNAATRAAHAAGFADLAGNIHVAREDVGRHNALDKMIGAALRLGYPASAGFVVVTSRCSFEMVEKAAIFGARAVVAISAPTSLAIERAQYHGMGLMALARPDSGVVFAGRKMFATEIEDEHHA